MNSSKPRVQIIIAAHKSYQMPEDLMYLPLHVGAEGKKDQAGNPLDLGYVKDNTGDNISELNSSFCELTGMYWAWKNLDAEYIGLAHYRRHFTLGKKGKDPFESVLRYEQIQPFLGKIKVFTPGKRRYYIETLYSHYAHTHYASQLDETRAIISEKYPDYLDSFDKIMRRRSGYMFNMMIMEKSLFDAYCSWLFDILFELQKRVDMPELSAFQGRFFGRVSEIIFNVWLDEQVKCGRIHKGEIKDLHCIHMEKINWLKKGSAFLKAKFTGKKYDASF